MGTEILRPQDCLTERLRFSPTPSFSHRRTGDYANPNTNSRSYRKRPEPRKRTTPSPTKAEPLKKSTAAAPVDLALGKVTILKRGETLDLKRKEETLKKIFSTNLVDLKRNNENLKKTFSGDLQCFESKKKNESLKKTFSGDLLLGGTQRLGPDPELVPIRLTNLKPLYAGSAFALSPSPRALPLPKFSMKKEGSCGFATVDDSATNDLRRLLRIG